MAMSLTHRFSPIRAVTRTVPKRTSKRKGQDDDDDDDDDDYRPASKRQRVKQQIGADDIVVTMSSPVRGKSTRSKQGIARKKNKVITEFHSRVRKLHATANVSLFVDLLRDLLLHESLCYEHQLALSIWLARLRRMLHVFVQNGMYAQAANTIYKHWEIELSLSFLEYTKLWNASDPTFQSDSNPSGNEYQNEKKGSDDLLHYDFNSDPSALTQWIREAEMSLLDTVHNLYNADKSSEQYLRQVYDAMSNALQRKAFISDPQFALQSKRQDQGWRPKSKEDLQSKLELCANREVERDPKFYQKMVDAFFDFKMSNMRYITACRALSRLKKWSDGLAWCRRFFSAELIDGRNTDGEQTITQSKCLLSLVSTERWILQWNGISGCLQQSALYELFCMLREVKSGSIVVAPDSPTCQHMKIHKLVVQHGQVLKDDPSPPVNVSTASVRSTTQSHVAASVSGNDTATPGAAVDADADAAYAYAAYAADAHVALPTLSTSPKLVLYHMPALTYFEEKEGTLENIVNDPLFNPSTFHLHPELLAICVPDAKPVDPLLSVQTGNLLAQILID